MSVNVIEKFFLVLCACLLVSGCVTEVTGDAGRFDKKPSREKLEEAMDTYVRLAYEEMALKNYDSAMNYLERARKIDDGYAPVLNATGWLHQVQGEKELARKNFQKAISADSSFSAARLNYGNFLAAQGEYPEACKQFRAAAEDITYDRRDNAYYALGLLCHKPLKQRAEEEQAYMRCLAIQPRHAGAMLELSEIRFDQGRASEAKGLLEQHRFFIKHAGQILSPRGAWLGIRIERQLGNQDAEASLSLYLKNTFPHSKEYQLYKESALN
jgi:type IV pilus assembly protein PilF